MLWSERRRPGLGRARWRRCGLAACVAIAALTATPAAAQTGGDGSGGCTTLIGPLASTMRFGSDLGLATGPALVPGLVGTALALSGDPETATRIQSLLNDTVYEATFAGAEVLREQAEQGIDALEDASSSLAAANDVIDTGIVTFADSLDQVAADLGPQIQPVDRVLVDVAAAARYFGSETCS